MGSTFPPPAARSSACDRKQHDRHHTTTHSTWGEGGMFRRPSPATLLLGRQLKTRCSWILPFEPALSTLLVSHCTDRCCCTTLPHPILTPSSPHPHPIQCPHPYLIAHLHSPCALCSMHMCSVPSNAALLPHPAPPRTAPVPALVPLPPVFEGI